MAAENSRGGINIAALTFIVFLTLKLAQIGPVAHWSWWWVTAPLWGCAAAAILAVCVIGILVWILDD